MNSSLLAEAGVFTQLGHMEVVVIFLIVLVLGLIFKSSMTKRNAHLVGDGNTTLRGDSFAEDFWEFVFASALAGSLVWYFAPWLPLSPLAKPVVTAGTAAANQPEATAAQTATATSSATFKDFPPALLPQIVWKGDAVTFPTATPDSSLSVGEFFYVAYKPSANEAESWKKGYKLKPDRGGVYTLPSGVTDVRIYGAGAGVQTYPETLTKQP